jgi:hypothetical protein
LALGPIDALNHLLGIFLPALGVGALAAALAKALWRSELRSVRWARLARWSGTAGALASLAGLVVFGRDGMMATYGAMVLASAVALWWAGFGPGRR